MIPFMCKLLHEQPYQAKMDLGCLVVLFVGIILGWPIIKMQLATFRVDEDEETR